MVITVRRYNTLWFHISRRENKYARWDTHNTVRKDPKTVLDTDIKAADWIFGILNTSA